MVGMMRALLADPFLLAKAPAISMAQLRAKLKGPKQMGRSTRK
jgi:hypothetical protein